MLFLTDNRRCVNSLKKMCGFTVFQSPDVGCIGLKFLARSFPYTLIITDHHYFISALDQFSDFYIKTIVLNGNLREYVLRNSFRADGNAITFHKGKSLTLVPFDLWIEQV